MMENFHKRSSNGKGTISEDVEESQIEKFYAGKTIFITGSTGYMGKCLVEKYLRSCPDLKQIYVLVRPKRGSSFEERMKTQFDDVVFGPLLKMYPDCQSKIHAVGGDLMSENLGLSESDRKMLREEVNFIIHNASNVKFTERLSSALRINVLGTAKIIELAKECKKLEAFMYVSTAYSNCWNKVILEKCYEPPVDEEGAKKIVAADLATKEGLSETEIKRIIGHFPNAYCFTKATAEGLVEKMGKEVSFPCTIYRPAIVISSWKEPLRSWCGSLNGPAVLFLGYALGVYRVAYLLDSVIDFIPVDMTINSMIASLWDITKNRPANSGTFVYNYGSSGVKPITLRTFRKRVLPNYPYMHLPSIHTVWPQWLTITECRYYFTILNIFVHYIPALLVDGYLTLTGKKRIALAAYKRGMLNLDALLDFAHGDWRIEATAIHNTVDRMSATDRQLFYCDIRTFDWAQYGETYWEGLRVYLLKDPLSTVPEATKKLEKLFFYQAILRYTLIAVFTYFLLFIFGIL